MPVMQITAEQARRTRPGLPLAAANFVPIGRNGLNDPANAYAHSMGWFGDRLFVGVTRHTQWASKKYDLNEYSGIWPVEVPDFVWEHDWRSRIWRFDPKTAAWDCVHLSRLCMGTRGFEVPLQVGFRDMQVFQGRSDRKPALYVTSWGSHMGVGPFVLRSEDGDAFTEVSEPNYPWFGTQTLRSLVALNGKLFTAPTGRCGITEDRHDGCMVLVSDDPARGVWQPACRAFFGDRRNLTVFDMGTFAGHLYAGTMNPSEGFQLWKTDAEGTPPYRWTRVLSHGAGRGPLNEGIVSFCEFGGALYIGTGIYNCGYDRTHKIGPGAPELLRVWPDDSWDLIVGDLRSGPGGLRVPRSGLGPGFNNPFAGYLWRMCSHDGWLYASTAVWSPWLPFTRVDTWPEQLRRMLDRMPLEDLMADFGGFDLWRSRDGDRWAPVTRNGFGNPFNIGARTMVSSPYGLFAGTSNSFGPRVATKRAAGWRYETDPRVGFEVWMGTHEPVPREVSFGRTDGVERPAPEPPIVLRGGSGAEDLVNAFYDGSGFRQVGWWRKDAPSPAACDALVAEVAAFLLPPASGKMPRYPTEEEFRSWMARRNGNPAADPAAWRGIPWTGRLLEIGCGAGATTRALRRRLPAATVTAIAAIEEEAAVAERNLPGAQVVWARLPKIPFPAATFDAVVSLEGPALHGRRRLLKEIARVLRPGGLLALSDFMVDPTGETDDPPPAGTDAYAALLAGLGFEAIQVIDVTERCAVPFRRRVQEFHEMQVLAGIDQETLQAFRALLPGGVAPIDRYLLAGARKRGGPATGDGGGDGATR